MAYVSILSNSEAYGNGLNGQRSPGSCESNFQLPQFKQESLEVTESGRAVKVQTDKPHLVSLGSGRLSTSVTLHPLQEGLTRIGTIDASVPQDIIIAGTGVESEHCYISNDEGVVTLHPISEKISIDALKVATPTRLTQGCMLCLGRSNYFRFNHPQEAQMMKTIFPNSRISVVPINFHQELPNVHEQLRSQLSEMTSINSQNRNEKFRDELESEDFVEKVSKFEFLAHSKQNSSPSEQQWWYVKEGLRFPQNNTLPRSSSSSSSHARSSSSSAGTFSPPGSSHFDSKPTSPPPLGSNLMTTALPSPIILSKPANPPTSGLKSAAVPPRSCGTYSVAKVSSPPTVPAKPGTVTVCKPPLPSPKLPAVAKIDSHISPKVFLPTAAANTATSEKPRHLPGRCTPTYHRQNGLGNHCSLEDLRHCERELQKKHQKVIKERIREQELGKQEQQRLEEILSMCADYERQVQREKIGKQSGKSSSGEGKDRPDSSTSSGTANSPIPSPGHIIHMNRIKTNGSLPRDRMAGCLSPTRDSLSPTHPARSFKSTSSEDELDHIFDFSFLPPSSGSKGRNKGGNDGGGDYAMYPQSPRTHIKTVVPKQNTISNMSEAGGEIFENQLALTISDDQLLSMEKNASSRSSTSSKGSAPISPSKQLHADVGHHNLVPRMDLGMLSTLQLSPRLVQDDNYNHPNSSGTDSFNERGYETLKSTRGSLVQRLSEMKTKILDLESQEEEALNELELECALLDGEFQDQGNILRQQEELLNSLKHQEKHLAESSDRARMQEHINIIATRKKAQELENILMQLQKEVELKNKGKDISYIIEKIQHHQEMLETERKNFEDLEFQLLEHDAHREEEKDQVLQQQNKIVESCHTTRENLADIMRQKNDLLSQVKKETGAAELERQILLLHYKMEKQKLHAIETKMNAGVVRRIPSKSISESPDSSPRSSDGDLQNKSLEEKLRQLGIIGRSSDPEELISRMTASVPLLPKDGMASGRTTATLQEIERSRQKILEVQGVLVIEQERRRLEELKRRAANEVCAQWNERKQREASSLPSSESERSSASSSDIPAESVTSEEAFGKFTDSERNSSSVSTGKESSDDPDKVHQREHKLTQAADDMRPLSGSSSQDDWMDVKLREKHRLQRPLTRYLPVRGEHFDLKQHIETAGHQIEQCAQIQLGSTSCRGYLHKMGSKFKTWNKRWFVFDRSKRALVYYPDKHEHKARGGVYFQAIEEVYVDHLHSVKSPNPNLTFCVKTLDRTFYLMAPNAESMRIWVDVIFTGAEGYREFQMEM